MAISRVGVLAEEFGDVGLQQTEVRDAMARQARTGRPSAVVLAVAPRGVQLPVSGVRRLASDLQATVQVRMSSRPAARDTTTARLLRSRGDERAAYGHRCWVTTSRHSRSEGSHRTSAVRNDRVHTPLPVRWSCAAPATSKSGSHRLPLSRRASKSRRPSRTAVDAEAGGGGDVGVALGTAEQVLLVEGDLVFLQARLC